MLLLFPESCPLRILLSTEETRRSKKYSTLEPSFAEVSTKRQLFICFVVYQLLVYPLELCTALVLIEVEEYTYEKTGGAQLIGRS